MNRKKLEKINICMYINIKIIVNESFGVFNNFDSNENNFENRYSPDKCKAIINY